MADDPIVEVKVVDAETGEEVECVSGPVASSDDDSFLQAILAYMCEAIEDPGRACAQEAFVIERPADWSDERWDDFIAEFFFHVGDPQHPELGRIIL